AVAKLAVRFQLHTHATPHDAAVYCRRSREGETSLDRSSILLRKIYQRCHHALHRALRCEQYERPGSWNFLVERDHERAPWLACHRRAADHRLARAAAGKEAPAQFQDLEVKTPGECIMAYPSGA